VGSGRPRTAPDGGVLASLRLLGIDPRQYLIDTLHALATTPKRPIGTLTPTQYAARTRAAAARTI
jgi:hypothetical protein